MEVEGVVCLWFLCRRYKRQTQYWVHPILRDKVTHGMFVTLYTKLREYEQKCFNYFRMSIKSFDDFFGIN
jgi:hypothetical protein